MIEKYPVYGMSHLQQSHVANQIFPEKKRDDSLALRQTHFLKSTLKTNVTCMQDFTQSLCNKIILTSSSSNKQRKGAFLAYAQNAIIYQH